MIQSNKHNQKKLSWAFLAAGILIEILNVVLAFQLGKHQANSCPKDDLPGQLVMVFTIISTICMVIFAKFAGQYKTIAYLFALAWTILIALGGYFLFIVASGVINWCNWTY